MCEHQSISWNLAWLAWSSFPKVTTPCILLALVLCCFSLLICRLLSIVNLAYVKRVIIYHLARQVFKVMVLLILSIDLIIMFFFSIIWLVVSTMYNLNKVFILLFINWPSVLLKTISKYILFMFILTMEESTVLKSFFNSLYIQHLKTLPHTLKHNRST